MRQIGAELIGLDSVAAVSEIVRVAAEALRAAGLEGLAIDFTLPDLVDTLAGDTLASAVLAELRDRLDAKDAGGVAAIDSAYLPLIEAAARSTPRSRGCAGSRRSAAGSKGWRRSPRACAARLR